MFMLKHLVDCCVVVFEQTELHQNNRKWNKLCLRLELIVWHIACLLFIAHKCPMSSEACKLLVKKSIQLANTSKLKHSPPLTESFEMFLLKIDCFLIVAEYCFLMLRCSNQLSTYLRSFAEKNGWNEMLVDSQTSTTKKNEEAYTSTKCSSIQPSQWTALSSLSSSPTQTIIVVVTCDKTRQIVCEGGPYRTRRGPPNQSSTRSPLLMAI